MIWLTTSTPKMWNLQKVIFEIGPLIETKKIGKIFTGSGDMTENVNNIYANPIFSSLNNMLK